jgi:hypothetical protein
LEEFALVYATPTELPPSWSTNNQIPLVNGAQPIKFHPYRYSPQLKNEIEHQVKDNVEKWHHLEKCQFIPLSSVTI